MNAGRGSRPDPLPPLRLVGLDAAGPEDVVFDAAGRVLTGLGDGRLVRIALPRRPGDRADIREVGRTGGRPLGLDVLPDGRLLVCDAERGLLRLDPEDASRVEVLADSIGGRPLRFCSNVVAASDGTLYFTVSSLRYGLGDWPSDIVEHRGTGLLVRLAAAGEPEVLLEGLQFANGVALAPDESFVVVAETGARRLTRWWLTGPEAGRRDTFADDLPGHPDNMSRSAGGGFWVALAAPRTPPLDWLHRTAPSVRRAAAAATRRLPTPPARAARAMEVDVQGRILRHLKDTGRRFRMATGVAERDGRLVLGSLAQDAVAWCELR